MAWVLVGRQHFHKVLVCVRHSLHLLRIGLFILFLHSYYVRVEGGMIQDALLDLLEAILGLYYLYFVLRLLTAPLENQRGGIVVPTTFDSDLFCYIR